MKHRSSTSKSDLTDVQPNILRVATQLSYPILKVLLPAKLRERTHATKKTNIKIAFLSSDIKVRWKALHTMITAEVHLINTDSQSLRSDILFSFYKHQGRAGYHNPACGRGWFLVHWLATVQRKKDFQTVQHPWSSVRSTLVRILF